MISGVEVLIALFPDSSPINYLARFDMYTQFFSALTMDCLMDTTSIVIARVIHSAPTVTERGGKPLKTEAIMKMHGMDPNHAAYKGKLRKFS